MSENNEGALDLSTTNNRRSPDRGEPYVKVEPASPNPSDSESDSGLDIVDSARNSTDERLRGSPSASVNSNSALSPKHETQFAAQDGQFLPMPTMVMLPQSSGFTARVNEGLKLYPYDPTMSMIMNPLMTSMPAVDPNPFPGSVTQLLSQRRRRTGEKRAPTNNEDSDTATGTTTPPKKAQGTPVPSDKKDESYWERRRRNNDAAKRSRDMRRRKEEEIAARAAYLEQENVKLRTQVAVLKTETARLHYLLCNHNRALS